MNPNSDVDRQCCRISAHFCPHLTTFRPLYKPLVRFNTLRTCQSTWGTFGWCVSIDNGRHWSSIRSIRPHISMKFHPLSVVGLGRSKICTSSQRLYEHRPSLQNCTVAQKIMAGWNSMLVEPRPTACTIHASSQLPPWPLFHSHCYHRKDKQDDDK